MVVVGTYTHRPHTLPVADILDLLLSDVRRNGAFTRTSVGFCYGKTIFTRTVKTISVKLLSGNVVPGQPYRLMTSLCHTPFEFPNGARHRFFSVAVGGIAAIPSALGYSLRSLRNFQTISAVGPPSEILRFGAVTFSLAIYAHLLRANDSDHAKV